MQPVNEYVKENTTLNFRNAKHLNLNLMIGMIYLDGSQ